MQVMRNKRMQVLRQQKSTYMWHARLHDILRHPSSGRVGGHLVCSDGCSGYLRVARQQTSGQEGGRCAHAVIQVRTVSSISSLLKCGGFDNEMKKNDKPHRSKKFFHVLKTHERRTANYLFVSTMIRNNFSYQIEAFLIHKCFLFVHVIVFIWLKYLVFMTLCVCVFPFFN